MRFFSSTASRVACAAGVIGLALSSAVAQTGGPGRFRPGSEASKGPVLTDQLPTDDRLTIGTLDNGLRYVVRPHNNPPGKVGVWIHIGTGSLNETDEQRGLAHYLEHMAFNGSENFPPGEVVKYFESIGLTFGRDQNAFTTFDQTAYQLYLPDTEQATLAKGLTFFKDVASAEVAFFGPQQIQHHAPLTTQPHPQDAALFKNILETSSGGDVHFGSGAAP